MSEAELFEAIRTTAGFTGWGLYHTYDARRSNPGYPDLTMWHPRRRLVLFRELKTESGRLTIDQADTIDALREAGADVDVWRPADLDAAVSLLLGTRPG